MIRLYRHVTISVIFSAILMIICLVVIAKAFSGISDSYGTIKTSRAIKNDPNSLKADITILESRKEGLESELSQLESLQIPELELFSEIAKKHGLKLTGVHLKAQSVLKDEQGKKYQLTFTGRLTSALNALDYIENNLILAFESIKLTANESNEKHIDLSMFIIIPE